MSSALMGYARTLRALAEQGSPDKSHDRIIMALLCESQARQEALMVEYLNRLNVLLQQREARANADL